MQNENISDLDTIARHQVKLSDVVSTFNLLPLNNFEWIEFKGSGKISTQLMDHIQGFVRTDEISIFTINQDHMENGTFFLYDNQSNEYIGTYTIPVKDLNHPAGAQNIGDYMVFGHQSQDYKINEVYYLNTTRLKDNPGAPNGITRLDIPLGDQSCASVAITDIASRDDGSFKYVLGISGGQTTTIYISNPTTIGFGDANLKFEKANVIINDSFQGIQLLTQKDGKVYLIAFDESPISDKKISTSFNDYFLLYELTGTFDSNLKAKELKKIACIYSWRRLPFGI